MKSPNEFGKLGEQMACDFLIQNGYRIRHRNFRHLKAEIDIIAQKGSILAVVEVKSRQAAFLEGLSEAVNRKKRARLVAAADHYVTERDLEVEVRFDIITIQGKEQGFEIEHLEDAFYHF